MAKVEIKLNTNTVKAVTVKSGTLVKIIRFPGWPSIENQLAMKTNYGLLLLTSGIDHINANDAIVEILPNDQKITIYNEL